MNKRKHSSDVVLYIVGIVIAIMGVLFILNVGGGLQSCSVIFAVASVAIGITYMVYASSESAASRMLEWPMLQGLIDIILGIVLFMSAGTRNPVMIVYIMAIWALMGVVARVFSAIKLKSALRTSTLISAGFCLASALVMAACALFVGHDYTLWVGIGLIVFASGSFFMPRKRKAG